MTLRSVILGLLGAVFICGFTYFNDHIIRQTYMVGCNMPPIVFGTVALILIAINPLLDRIRKGWQLSAKELVVIIAITLPACAIPSAGLMECFPDAIMMPHMIVKNNPGWQSEKIIEDVPKFMLPDISEDEGTALTGYVQGLSQGTESISVADVPWSAWTRTLAFWLPVVLLMWVGLIGLSLVVHRQWSDHEQLPYPIAAFVNQLLPVEGQTPVYRQRLFWLGCGAICGIHLINYAAVWWPKYMIPIPTSFDLGSLDVLFPTLSRVGGWILWQPKLYFAIIGLAFLLPTDVSFSVGIGPVLYFLVAGVLAGFGISMSSGGWYSMGVGSSLQAGAYCGMFLMIVYTGRRYYSSVFRRALGLEPKDEVEGQAVWGARIFMSCAVIFMILLMVAGLDWLLAIGFTLLAFIAFMVIGRICAESGYIFIQPYWEPAGLIVGVLGYKAVGPTTALLMFLISTAVLIDTREPLVPFLLNSFRLLDKRKVSVSKTTGFSVAAIVLGVAVAVPVTLYLKYDNGTDLNYGWASDAVPRFPFDAAVKMKQRLKSQGRLEESESVSGFGRILAMSPDKTLVVGFLVAVVLFLGLSVLRFRLPSWPLHPILLLIWGVGPAARYVYSFLLGCLIKRLIIKYGGDKAYRLVMPIFIGLIAADMLFGLTTGLIGAVYYMITGTPPPRFVVLIG